MALKINCNKEVIDEFIILVLVKRWLKLYSTFVFYQKGLKLLYYTSTVIIYYNTLYYNIYSIQREKHT